MERKIKLGDYKKCLDNNKKSINIAAKDFWKLKIHLKQYINISQKRESVGLR